MDDRTGPTDDGIAMEPFETIRVAIAHPAPFRFIQRDAQDTLVASTGEVNASTYQNLKLHRVSKFFDANRKNPSPLGMAFSGGFLLPLDDSLNSIEATLDEFNRIFAAILLGGIYINAVSIDELAQGELTREGYFRIVKPFGYTAELHDALATRSAGNAAAGRLLTPTYVLASDMISAYRTGSDLLATIPNLTPSLFVTAFTHFVSGRYRESLTHGWVSIEQCLENLWKFQVLEAADTEGVPGRGKFLGSNQWTAAHKVEVMYVRGLLSKEAYVLLNQARTARNRFIHRGQRPTEDDTRSSLAALVEILATVAGLKSIRFERGHLDRYIDTHTQPSHGETFVGRAEQVDWTKVGFYRILSPIPGEKHWKGDFETFPDIRVVATARRSQAGKVRPKG